MWRGGYGEGIERRLLGSGGCIQRAHSTVFCSIFQLRMNFACSRGVAECHSDDGHVRMNDMHFVVMGVSRLNVLTRGKGRSICHMSMIHDLEDYDDSLLYISRGTSRRCRVLLRGGIRSSVKGQAPCCVMLMQIPWSAILALIFLVIFWDRRRRWITSLLHLLDEDVVVSSFKM